MQSEHFDKKIREAADQHSTAYHEGAWDKMERLLDKHLPQQRTDRRRLLLFLLFFIILSGSIYVLVSKPFGGGKSISKTETIDLNSHDMTVGADTLMVQKKPGNETATDDQPDTVHEQGKEIKLNAEQRTEIQKATAVPADNAATLSESSLKKKAVVAKSTDEHQPDNPLQNQLTAIPGKKNISNESAIKESTKENPVETEKSNTEKNITKTEALKEEENKTGEEDIQKNEELKQAETPVAEKKFTVLKPKKQSGLLSRFAIVVSAGPDVSAVGFNNIGKTQFVYGAGLSYAVSPRITLRSGLYAARKIYTASPQDYDPPSNFWNYYPNLKKIDADCRALELPLLLDYNFGSSKNQSWFVSVGTSSVFMKKETYDYLFKPPYAPQYVTYSHTYKNENKHYFSMLSLSGGYTRVFNKNISLRAEPYIRIPLKGIGYGKVDLSSGGVLFSAIIKPFSVTTSRQ